MPDLAKRARDVIKRGEVLTDKEVLEMADEIERRFQEVCDLRAERNVACQHLNRWLDWCDGPADPHPLDQLNAVRKFLSGIKAGENDAQACRQCGGAMTVNPHPEAGMLGNLNKVGDSFECIPCLIRTRYEWSCLAWDYGNRVRQAAQALQAPPPQEPTA